ncbi:hypothetical protein Tco_1058298 [Tanacetum coccineum]|uniref:Uncharacterized protein n=1 Tax=Tanacetum coccineum TaxID=301880 RepID=A0ABQ5H7X9_9ASTR
MTSHPNVTVPLLKDFGGVTDWYQEPSIIDMPPSINQVNDLPTDEHQSPYIIFGFPASEPHDFDDSYLEFEEDPQEEVKEDPQRSLRRNLKKILKRILKKKKNQKKSRRRLMGSPYPPPPVSPNSEPKMDITRDRAWRVVQKVTRVENIKEGSGLRDGMRRRFEKEPLRRWFELVAEERPNEAIDVLAVYGEPQPPKPHRPPDGS